ncbi:hypothetical protein ASZ90_015440 [hydrocarbon metagenome]|uniref:Uncharacterized protein n=1 Tax=hydrocarbon metagenome TaxID=938273 RepID=A0A0W8F2V0_9ZZZZ
MTGVRSSIKDENAAGFFHSKKAVCNRVWAALLPPAPNRMNAAASDGLPGGRSETKPGYL